MEDLFERFYLGLYSKIVNESGSVKSPQEDVEFILLRSRLGINQIDFVLKAVRASDTPMHKGVEILAKMERSNGAEPEFDQSLLQTSPYYALCASLVYLKLGKFDDALSILNGVSHQEAPALRVQALLGLNRADLAEKELGKISNVVLKGLASAWVGLQKDSDATQSALFALQDIAERYEMSPLLANTIACCHFTLGEWESGKMVIQEAIERYPNDEALQVNNAVAMNHTGDYEGFSNQVSLIMSQNNQYTAGINSLLEDFDSTAQRLSSSE